MLSVNEMPKRFKGKNFENFDVDKSNEKQVEACKNFEIPNSLLLCGNTGTGKTHLAIAILKSAKRIPYDSTYERKEIKQHKDNLESRIRDIERYAEMDKLSEKSEKDLIRYKKYMDDKLYESRNPRTIFISVVELIFEINDYYSWSGAKTDVNGKKTKLDFLNSFSDYDIVCLDDFGAQKLSEANRQDLYYLINKRYLDCQSVILTTNFSIEQINEFEPRIASRLSEMGQILNFNGEDFRVK